VKPEPSECSPVKLIFEDFDGFDHLRRLTSLYIAGAAWPENRTDQAVHAKLKTHRGRLVIERIAGKDYTTLADIERMRTLCRVEAKVPASGPASNGCMSDTERPARRRGAKTFNGGATHKKMTGPNRPVSFRLACGVRFSRFRLGS
jgi:hypothetical protein